MGHEEKTITYFERPGNENTAHAIKLAIKSADEWKAKKIIVASSTGSTALSLKEKAPSREIIAVTYSAGCRFREAVAEWNKKEAEVVDKGILVVKGLHGLSGVNRSITNKLGGTSQLDIISQTLRILSQGFKVCIEIATMAAEAGLASIDEDVVVVAGEGRGSDTVIVLSPAYADDIFSTKIKEIVCIPRGRSDGL